MYKPEITFPAYQDGDTIPFLYDNSGRIITKVIIGVDTLEFMVDTGADVSIVPATYKNSDVMYKRLTDYLGRKITDASGITKRIYSVTIKKMKWGNIIFKDQFFSAPKSYKKGVIGGDLLRNFCVKFDNEKNRIILSQKKDVISTKGMKIPFNYSNNCILVKGILVNPLLQLRVNEVIAFMFDTGNNLELMLTKKSYRMLNIQEKEEITWIEPWNSLHSHEGKYSADSTIHYSLVDFKFGDKLFRNSIISCRNSEGQNNYIGMVFMNRFRSFTIDYPNRMLYLELPNNTGEYDQKQKKTQKFFVELPEGVKMDFSGEIISDFPAAYINLAYGRLNGSGINFNSDSSVTVVNTIIKENKKQGINIGDTLVGIDDLLFDKRALKIIHQNRSNYKFRKDTIVQTELAFEKSRNKNSVYCHFLKNGKIVTLHDKHIKLVNPSPVAVYSFGEQVFSYYNYFSHNYMNLNNGNYNFHLIKAPFSGKEVEFMEWTNGKKKMVSNK